MGVTLHCGDCLSILPTIDGVDAVVSDPPYGIKYERAGQSRNSIDSTGKRRRAKILGDDRPFDPSPWLVFPAVAFTGAQHFYHRLPPGGSMHCWDKRGDYKPLDQADADVIWCSVPLKSRLLHLAWRGICRHAEHNQKFEHPTQKPIALMRWIIGLLKLKPGATVLDPYLGSGSTGVAAIELGFNFVGIESDPTYFAAAERRIAAAQNKHPLLASQPDSTALPLPPTG